MEERVTDSRYAPVLISFLQSALNIEGTADLQFGTVRRSTFGVECWMFFCEMPHAATSFSIASACLRAASLCPPNIRANSVTRSRLSSKLISEVVRPAFTSFVTT
jgi:hypothetical protein